MEIKKSSTKDEKDQKKGEHITTLFHKILNTKALGTMKPFLCTSTKKNLLHM